jgi:hypothetical protein
MPKDLSTDFETEMREEENRPFLILSIFFGDEKGVWRLTTLDEDVSISYDDPQFLKEP